MAKDFARAFYNSKAWKNCRDSFIRQRTIVDGGMCQVCHSDLGYIVHHRTKLTADNIGNPDVSLNHDNLQYVCKKCHDLIHFEDMNGKPKVNSLFGEDGQPIDIRNI